MGAAVRVAATAAMLGLGFLGTSGQAAVILDSLTVRIYDNAGVLAGDRARAITRANEILSRADLTVDWRDCPAGGMRNRGNCLAPPARGDLAVRLVRSPKSDPHSRALGTALIDDTTGSGTLATVYVDRVMSVAGQAKTDVWGMVGRVMAHEIGHLLLGSNSHSASGLMREIWTLRDLARNRPQDWSFSRAQRDELRNQRITRKSTATQPAG